MAKVINPLFSTEARGRLGGIVFQTGVYGQTVRTHYISKKEASDSQMEWRYRFGLAQDAWREASEEERQAFHAEALRDRISVHNAFVRHFMNTHDFEGE